MSSFIGEFGEEYSRCRIYKGLKTTLQKCFEVFPLTEAEFILKSREFDFEVLLDRPNQQITLQIFEIQTVLQKYCEKVEEHVKLHPEALESQVSLQTVEQRRRHLQTKLENNLKLKQIEF